ncbi:MAG TPA: ABC transporter permease [Anaeromyxobacter sp.]|nr:ABC transporter permease [Anaeromyxobacter sp.]
MNPVQTDSAARLFWRENAKALASFGVVVLLIAVGGAVSSGFASSGHVLMLVKTGAFLGFLSLAQLIVIVSGNGGIDLSVGAVASVGAVVGAALLRGQDANAATAFAVVAALGLAVGLANGLMVSFLGLPPLIVTLAMASVVNGSIYIYSKGLAVSATSSPLLKSLSNGTTLGIPNAILVWIAVSAACGVVLKYTRTGVKLYGVGANELAATLKGVKVPRFRFWVYGASGLISAVSGLLLLGYIGTAFLDIGSRYVLPSVAAVTIGGVSIQGGAGGYLQVVAGTLVLTVLSALLVSLQTGEAGRQIVLGLVLLLLLAIYGRERTRGGSLGFFSGLLHKRRS